jgi:CRP/FNR family transcriptional regulator, cyclic AMP receptor protein
MMDSLRNGGLRPALASAAATLGARGWLAGRDAAFRDLLLSAARSRTFQPKQAVYRVSVSVSIPTESGVDYLAVRTDPGFWIGDLALFSEQRRLVSVIAATSVRALFVSSFDMLAMVRQDPARYRDFYALTYENMALTLRLLTNVATPGSDQRLGLRLLQHDDAHSTAGEWLVYSQDELAQMLAMSSPTLQRALKRLSQAGMVEVGYARIRVVDRDRLIRHCAA